MNKLFAVLALSLLAGCANMTDDDMDAMRAMLGGFLQGANGNPGSTVNCTTLLMAKDMATTSCR